MKFKFNEIFKKNFKKKNFNLIFNFLIIFLSITLVLFFAYKKYNSFYGCTNKEFKKTAELIKKIDNDCGIVKFLNKINPVDFLNIKEFSGNTVGCLELKNPEKWKGPYIEKNLTYNDKLLNILVHNDGYFIVPGNETVLSDGTVIGKEIIFNESCNLEDIKNEYRGLSPDGKCLICKLNINLIDKI